MPEKHLGFHQLLFNSSHHIIILTRGSHNTYFITRTHLKSGIHILINAKAKKKEKNQITWFLFPW